MTNEKHLTKDEQEILIQAQKPYGSVDKRYLRDWLLDALASLSQERSKLSDYAAAADALIWKEQEKLKAVRDCCYLNVCAFCQEWLAPEPHKHCPNCDTILPSCKTCGGSGEIDDLPWLYLPKLCEDCQEI